jgi:topoisomerase-4 subunit A
MNLIGLDGRPRVMDLRSLLVEWLAYREQTLRRRIAWRLEKVERRLHILAGLLIAFLNIDEVIAIIREAEAPKSELMARFGLTDTQAEAILEIRLRQLAKIEEIELRAEQDALEAERVLLAGMLDDPVRLRARLREELLEDAKNHGDARRSPLVAREAAQALTETELIVAEPVTVVLSRLGWVRMAKGHDLDGSTLAFKAGDGFLAQAEGRSTQPAVFLDDQGRAYSLPTHTLPSARGQGEPLTGRFSPPAGAAFLHVILGYPESSLLLAQSSGYGFIARLEGLQGRQRGGKAVVSVEEKSRLLAPAMLRDAEHDRVAVVSNTGRLLLFSAAQLPVLGRGKGNKLMGLSQGEHLAAVAILHAGEALVLHAGARTLTLKGADLDLYSGQRTQRGTLLPRGFQRVERMRSQGG